MAIPINIEDLLNKRKVESNRIELKTGWNPQSIYHTICAFANDLDNLGGGYILVGVEEENGIAKRPVKGLPIEQLDKIQKDDHVDGVLVGHLKDIYFVIKDNPNITIKQIADIISIKERRAKYLIDNLKTKGFIKRKGRGNGYWIILK